LNDLTKIDIVILCGGFGTRLKEVTEDKIPKCLVDINGKPFLNRLIDYLYKQGFRRFILATGYKSNMITKDILCKYVNCNFIFSHEINPLGTDGAIKLAETYVESKEYFVVNGDTYCEIHYKDIFQIYKNMNTPKGMEIIFIDNSQNFQSIKSGIFIYKKDWVINESMIKLKLPTPFIDIGTPKGHKELCNYFSGKNENIICNTNS